MNAKYNVEKRGNVQNFEVTHDDGMVDKFKLQKVKTVPGKFIDKARRSKWDWLYDALDDCEVGDKFVATLPSKADRQQASSALSRRFKPGTFSCYTSKKDGELDDRELAIIVRKTPVRRHWAEYNKSQAGGAAPAAKKEKKGKKQKAAPGSNGVALQPSNNKETALP